MAKAYWLVKSEPGVYSFDQLIRDKKTVWDHIRNFQARNNLRAMKKGDQVLYYHSQVGKAVVGIAEVAREAYPEKTSDKGDWSAVDIAAVKALKKPVTLDQVKATAALQAMQLVTHSRLSVQSVTPAEYAAILKLGS
ncbi:MAG: EVE domain-containing protein [Sandaracinaceae bacterium]|nr:EVE domain-containing protein [Sandaracinaceae bacterium]